MQEYLAALAAQPYATRYWWVYAMLVSTMIPSLVNLVVATFYFLRSFKPFRLFILDNFVDGEPLPFVPRGAAALVLTFQHWLASGFATLLVSCAAFAIAMLVRHWVGEHIFGIVNLVASDGLRFLTIPP